MNAAVYLSDNVPDNLDVNPPVLQVSRDVRTPGVIAYINADDYVQFYSCLQRPEVSEVKKETKYGAP